MVSCWWVVVEQQGSVVSREERLDWISSACYIWSDNNLTDYRISKPGLHETRFYDHSFYKFMYLHSQKLGIHSDAFTNLFVKIHVFKKVPDKKKSRIYKLQFYFHKLSITKSLIGSVYDSKCSVWFLRVDGLKRWFSFTECGWIKLLNLPKSSVFRRTCPFKLSIG